MPAAPVDLGAGHEAQWRRVAHLSLVELSIVYALAAALGQQLWDCLSECLFDDRDVGADLLQRFRQATDGSDTHHGFGVCTADVICQATILLLHCRLLRMLPYQ